MSALMDWLRADWCETERRRVQSRHRAGGFIELWWEYEHVDLNSGRRRWTGTDARAVFTEDGKRVAMRNFSLFSTAFAGAELWATYLRSGGAA